jgi:hypothetical protein
VFDHSAWLAEHLNNFLVHAERDVCWLVLAILTLFGIIQPNAATLIMRAALSGKRVAGVNTMATQPIQSP